MLEPTSMQKQQQSKFNTNLKLLKTTEKRVGETADKRNNNGYTRNSNIR